MMSFVCASLTFCAQPGTRGEAGHIYDLHGELLPRVPVDAAPHHTERSPTRQKKKKNLDWKKTWS